MAVVLLTGATSAVAGACGSDSATTTEEPDSGAEVGSVLAADCPKTQPANGSECLLPEGTTCDFGRCGTRLARCSRGRWQVASNSPPKPPCPDLPPNEGIPCPACWSPEVSCTYGSTDCSGPDASANTAIASCPAGGWVLDFRPCRDGGGADVQRDGGPDAD